MSTGGGGAMRIVPGSLDAAGQTILAVAGQTMGDQGSLSGAGSGPSACDPRAAEACSHMQAAMAQAMAVLQEQTSVLGQDVIEASAAYVTTDTHQMIADLFPGLP